MKFSVITPTADRPNKIRLIYDLLCTQREDWEWIICDNSWRPNPFFLELKDVRVKYSYSDQNITIGEKRNLLKEKAVGEYIVHFDDDDYYAPTYLQTVGGALADCDFFTLGSWFCYDSHLKQFYYWDTNQVGEKHFVLDPLTSGNVREVAFDAEWKERHEKNFVEQNRCGYGFSYAYRQEIARTFNFDAVDFGEDYRFYQKIAQKGYRICVPSDEEGLTLHILHDMNTARFFPQYRLPPFLGERLFSKAKHFLERYNDEN